MKSVYYLKTSEKNTVPPIHKIKSDEILVRIRCSSLSINDYERYTP